ncbi:hypothetical protein NVP2117O_81 [Vibrio phage 2.117.O._10N.261.45.E9]|nr:hypothetical protein NVP1117O_81 [Vibrio phage 1.117.O._10N.261.45.E9]AUR95482.1 hypothetical protein NVP1207B_75 [Vibrio phage 1.207.B._10N.222.51.C2]AUS02373.1 hypothetical protein NVP2117O_81 [Vibrio phage 2.117.O._10N.261.45.E9]
MKYKVHSMICTFFMVEDAKDTLGFFNPEECVIAHAGDVIVVHTIDSKGNLECENIDTDFEFTIPFKTLLRMADAIVANRE